MLRTSKKSRKLTSSRFLSFELRMCHRRFKAITWNALARFRPRAILIPEMTELYSLLSPSPVGAALVDFLFWIQTIVMMPIVTHNATVTNNLSDFPLRINLYCRLVF